MKIPFKWYLHGDEDRGDVILDAIRDKLGDMSVREYDELEEKIGRPFYEVTLDCELDTETGEVFLLHARL